MSDLNMGSLALKRFFVLRKTTGLLCLASIIFSSCVGSQPQSTIASSTTQLSPSKFVADFSLLAPPTISKLSEIDEQLGILHKVVPYDETTLFAICEAGELLILDISNPSKPTVFSSYDLRSEFGLYLGSDVSSFEVSDLVIRGKFAYVVVEFLLVVLDIEDLTSPRLVDCWTGEIPIGHIYVENNFAFLTSARGCLLQILDVSDPKQLVLLSELSLCNRTITPGFHDLFLLSDNYLLLVAIPGSLVLDISDPTRPLLVNSYDYVCRCICSLSNELFFVASLNKIAVLNMSDPLAITIVSELPLLIDYPTTCISIDSIVYADCGNNSLVLFDLTERSAPKLLTKITVEDCGFGSKSLVSFFQPVLGKQLLLCVDPYFGLLVFDLSSPSEPLLCGTFITGEFLHNVTVSESYIVLISTYSPLFQAYSFVDIFDRTIVPGESLTRLGRLTFPNETLTDAALAGNILFLSGLYQGLLLVDITEPTAPHFLDKYQYPDSFPYYMGGLAVDPERKVAYLCKYDFGLLVINWSNPNDLQLLSVVEHDVFMYPLAIDLHDDYVYLSCDHWEDGGFAIIDASNASAPQSLVWYYAGDCPALAVQDDILYLCSGTVREFYVMDISDKTAPIYCSTLNDDRSTWTIDIELWGRFALVATQVGVLFADVTNKNRPRTFGFLLPDTTTAIPTDLLVDGDTLFAVTGYDGLKVYQLTPARALSVQGGILFFVILPGTGSVITVASRTAYRSRKSKRK